MNAIEIKNLVKKFEGIHAVDRLSFGIPRATITGIVGPNGSGKTTLINIISGLTSCDEGILIFGGAALAKIAPHEISAYGITRTFQSVRLFEQMNVLDNILIALAERNVFSALFEKHGAYHVKKAEEFLGRVGLWEKRGALAVNLSYGQRKLLEIARARAMEAQTYLFDEPFAGLFPDMVKIVSGILRELRQEGKTVVLIEHDMGLIRELVDTVFVLDGGKLLAEGKPSEVLSRREVIEAYIGQ